MLEQLEQFDEDVEHSLQLAAQVSQMLSVLLNVPEGQEVAQLPLNRTSTPLHVRQSLAVELEHVAQEESQAVHTLLLTNEVAGQASSQVFVSVKTFAPGHVKHVVGFDVQARQERSHGLLELTGSM